MSVNSPGRRFLLVSGALLLSGVVCGGSFGAKETGKRFDMDGIEVLVPKGVLPKERPGVDWRQFHFFQGKKQLLFAYVGDHPRFPGNAPGETPQEAIDLNGLMGKSIRWKNDQGGMCREVLVDRGQEVAVGRLIHLIYSGLSAAEAEIAEQMISTLRNAPPPKRGKR